MNIISIVRYEDLRIDVQRARYEAEYPSRTRGTFVTIKHIPTGIEVCKYHKSALTAKDEAIKELEELIRNEQVNK